MDLGGPPRLEASSPELIEPDVQPVAPAAPTVVNVEPYTERASRYYRITFSDGSQQTWNPTLQSILDGPDPDLSTHDDTLFDDTFDNDDDFRWNR